MIAGCGEINKGSQKSQTLQRFFGSLYNLTHPAAIHRRLCSRHYKLFNRAFTSCQAACPQFHLQHLEQCPNSELCKLYITVQCTSQLIASHHRTGLESGIPTRTDSSIIQTSLFNPQKMYMPRPLITLDHQPSFIGPSSPILVPWNISQRTTL
jgi:hypothetical protein